MSGPRLHVALLGVAPVVVTLLGGCGRGDVRARSPEHSLPPPPNRASSPHPASRSPVRAAAALHVLAAPLPAARALEPLASPLRVEVLDSRGRPAVGAVVRWCVMRGGGRVVPTSSRADGAGVATTSWSPGPSADSQIVAVSVQGVGTVALSTSVAVARVSVLPDSLALWAGDSVVLRADLFDAARRPLAGGVLHWASADSTTARVTPGGTLIGARSGTTSITAEAGAARGATSVVVLPTVAGRLFAADGAAVPGARVLVRSGGRTDSVATTRDGRFALRLLAFPDDSVDVIVVPLDGRHRGARLRVRSARELGELRIVLLPTTWVVSGGRFAGRAIDVSAALALAPAADGSRFWRLERAGSRATWVPAAWRRELLPLRVTLRVSRAEPVAASDSIAFWKIARALERDLDAALFVPATEPAEAEGGMIHVVVDPASRDPGFTVASWDASGAIGDATVILRSRALLSDPTIVTHELLHALGVGHTSAWASVMASGGNGSPTITGADAAYVQLLLRLRRVQEASDAPYAVVEAAAAEHGGDLPARPPASRDRTRIR